MPGNMSKTALVISGGGSKGAFAAGIVKRLAIEQPDLRFDILVGTSTGALIVPLVALDELDLLEHLYTTVRTEDIITMGNVGQRLLSENSLYDARPLANLIKTHLHDERCQLLFNAAPDVYIATTCLQTGESVYFSNTARSFSTDYEVRKLNQPDHFRRAVMASACQPVLMPPIEVIPGSVPLRQYVDGGVREYAGVQLAIDAGAEEIYVILLSAAGNEVLELPFGNAMDILKQTVDIFIRDVGENDLKGPWTYNRALRYLSAVRSRLDERGISGATIDHAFDVPGDPFAGKKPLRIHLIRPDSALGGGPGGLVFDPPEMRAMFLRGELAVSTYLASR